MLYKAVFARWFSCRSSITTAQSVVNGKKRLKVRVLFNTGRQRSFITSRVVKFRAIEKSRHEWVVTSTFDLQVKEGGLKAVHKLELFPVCDGDGVEVEMYEVPNVSQVKNDHAHLQDLWFSDVCKSEAVLEVNVLIGADYLWCFQRRRTIRGEKDEPVVVETCLGWV